MTVHGDRIVVVGEVDGQPGLWRVQRGQIQSLIASHYYKAAAFNTDGTRLAVIYAYPGLLSTRYSLRVIDAPRA